MADSRTHYDLLGLERIADAVDIKRAWKVHVQVWHPDRFSGEMREQAEQQTARINAAYHVLKSEATRAAYDRQLEADSVQRRAAQARPARSPFTTAQPAQTGSTTAQQMAPQLSSGPFADLAAALDDLARTYPRAVLSTAAAIVLLFGGSIAMRQLQAPHVPASALQASAHTGSTTAEDSIDSDELFPARDLDVEATADLASGSSGAAPGGSSSSGSSERRHGSAPIDQGRGAPAEAGDGGSAVIDPYAVAPIPEPPMPRRVIRVVPKVAARHAR